MIANTRRPPIRSVSSPSGIRSSAPRTTGIEIITDVSMLERPSSSWMSGAIGASIPQAEKVTAKAIVASASCLVDSPLPAITLHSSEFEPHGDTLSGSGVPRRHVRRRLLLSRMDGPPNDQNRA